MRLKNTANHIMILATLLLCGACVDASYSLDEINTEVTIGQGKTTLPLGYIENKSIGELLDSEEVEGLIKDENGNYSFEHSGEGEPIEIDGIDHVVELPEVKSVFEAEYPVFDIVDYAHTIDQTFDIAPMFANQNVLSGYTVPIEAGHTITGHEESEVEHHLSYEVPEQIADLQCIYLKPTYPGDPGARIDMTFMLNDLSVVNGGGHVTLELCAPEGYNLYNENKEHIESGVFNVTEYDFAAGEDELDFVAYIASVENMNAVEDGVLDMPIILEYHISFEMTTIDGDLTLETGPQLRIASDLAYENADVVLNATTLFDHNVPTGGDMQITNLPDEILSIKEITFVESSPMVLFASGFEWVSEELANAIIIDAWLPDYITLHDDVSIGYDATEHRLHTTLANLRQGICVDLDAIEFEGDGCVVENGNLGLSFAPEIEARIEQGTVVRLSDIQHEGTMIIEAGVEAAELDIQHLSGLIDYSYNKSTQFEFKGLEDTSISIDGVGLQPVLTVNVVNPLSLDAVLEAEVVAVIDGQRSDTQRIHIEDIVVAAATVDGGVVTPKRSTFVLADESQRAEYEQEGVTFVPCDIETLFDGVIPNTFDFDVMIGTDTDTFTTLYAADDYTITYDYLFQLPIKLNNKLSLSYSHEFTGFGDTFDSIGDLSDFKVGDIAIIANVINTTPLAFGAQVELIDVEGNPTSVQVRLPEDVIISGSMDGVSEAESTFRMELLFDDGNVSQIGDIDGMRVTLTAKSMAEDEVAISESQYVGLRTYLEVDGGITIDIAE